MGTMTVGDFRKMLSQHPDDMEITFGASTFSKSALVFYRTKSRAKDLLLIEVSELAHPEDSDIASPEYEQRITVGYLLRLLDGVPENCKLAFNCTMDARRLVFHSMKQVLAIDLQQSDGPKSEEDCHN